MPIPVTRDAIEYLAGALRTVAAAAKHRNGQGDIYGIAMAGLDLAEHGHNGCAEMRGDGNKCPCCQRDFKDGETCTKGGCPMGGDV